MPTPTKKIENTTKHWTKEERERREMAEQELERKFVRLTEPRRVKEIPAAHEYWKNTIKRMKGLTMLDNVDSDLLAGYCLASAQADALRMEYREARNTTERTIGKTLEKVMNHEYADDEYPARVIRALMANELALLRSMQGEERLVIGYAKELGLTPNARQRLAKKAADERPVTEEDELYGM